MRNMLLSIALLTTSFCVAEEIIVPLTDISSIFEMKDLILSDNEELIFSVAAGTQIAFTFNVEGELVNIKMDKNHPIVYSFLQTMYLKGNDDDLFISLDRENWKPILEFFTGELKAELSDSDGAQPVVHFNLVLNARNEE